MSDAPVKKNPFELLSEASRATKEIGIARGEDILSERKEWPAEDMILPEVKRSQPRLLLEVKPGAELMKFKIRGLTLGERQAADAMLDEVIPPRKTRLETVPGAPPREIPDGYDHEDPRYLAEIDKAKRRQIAFVALMGTDGLMASVEGDGMDAKITKLMNVQERLVRFLSAEIWNFSYAGGDAADFFFKEG